METKPVRDVSDTAKWVATYRAEESERRDALFRDPLAKRVAGERGPTIARGASKHSRWALVTRTKLIDDLVLASVREGTDCVMNLAAGFDTRPYRLELPKALRWVEADLPALVDEKERLLAGETARCELSREAVDLTDPVARSAFLARAVGGAKKTLVVTEGLVVYLAESVVEAMAEDFARHAVHEWILDFSSPRIVADIRRDMGVLLENAPFKFAPPNGVAFFEKLGWKPRDLLSLFHAAARLKRLPLWMRPFALIPPVDPRKLGKERWSAVVRFER
ncbi:MAG TPA: SAM-dependent methyltransferase [Polyangiaceae bacterium]